MTQQHPITPPPELVQQWEEDWNHNEVNIEFEPYIAARAAQWGADTELEACCETIKNLMWFAQPTFRLAELRATRRPKPLKEAALGQLEEVRIDPEGGITYMGLDLIRRALEALPDD